MKLLLLSNSTQHGRGYLDHAIEEIREHFSGLDSIAFVPYALHDQRGYGDLVAARLQEAGLGVTTLPDDDRARELLEQSPGLFVGGGNTFRLLSTLHRRGLVDATRRRVVGGMRYMGSSAGTVIASPSMKTTNDMPIVQPPTFDALNLVRFQINPHYLDPDPGSTHMGETRETRLREFLEENETPVIGLREGSWLRVEGEKVVLGGDLPARIFRREREPEDFPPGSDLSFLNRG